MSTEQLQYIEQTRFPTGAVLTWFRWGTGDDITYEIETRAVPFGEATATTAEFLRTQFTREKVDV
jgi:hypothetical protein